MDKGLIRINELSEQIKQLEDEYANVGAIHFVKDNQLEDEEIKNKELREYKSSLNYEKEQLEYISKMLPKYKKNRNIFTTILALIIEIGIIILTANIAGYAANFAFLILNLCFLPGAFLFGDVKHYRYYKNYLKKYTIESINEKIDENNTKLNYSNEKIRILINEIYLLLENRKNLSNQIDSIQKEIQKINEIRSKVMREYLKDNKELDILINKEYDSYTEEKAKQNIKKKNEK